MKSNIHSMCSIGNKLYINGKEVEQPKSIFFKNQICISNKVYVNGKEYKKGKWRYTIKSLYHSIF